MCGGAQPPHWVNGADKARRPKADQEGRSAKGFSDAEGRLESQQVQRAKGTQLQWGPVSPGGIWPKPEFGKVRGRKLYKILVIRAENSSRHINSV